MNRRPVGKVSWFAVLLIIAATVLWGLEQRRAAETRSNPPARQTGTTAPASKPAAKKPEKSVTAGSYEVYHGCTLVEARNNDGDSFMVRLPDGRKNEFRLYFVDAPESAFKRYAGGDSNHGRIRQQAAELGGITPEQAVETGKHAKALTLDLLGRESFTIFTCWDSPFHDDRYHAFVEVRENGKACWLHRLLVERGLVRIKTKPADMPDGTPASKERDYLRELERQAKRGELGVWGL